MLFKTFKKDWKPGMHVVRNAQFCIKTWMCNNTDVDLTVGCHIGTGGW